MKRSIGQVVSLIPDVHPKKSKTYKYSRIESQNVA